MFPSISPRINVDEELYVFSFNWVKNLSPSEWQPDIMVPLMDSVKQFECFINESNPWLNTGEVLYPHLKLAIKNDLLFVSPYIYSTANRNVVMNNIMKYGEYLENRFPIKGKQASLKSILIVFSEKTDSEISSLTGMTSALRGALTNKGMILGQFPPLENTSSGSLPKIDKMTSTLLISKQVDVIEAVYNKLRGAEYKVSLN